MGEIRGEVPPGIQQTDDKGGYVFRPEQTSGVGLPYLQAWLEARTEQQRGSRPMLRLVTPNDEQTHPVFDDASNQAELRLVPQPKPPEHLIHRKTFVDRIKSVGQAIIAGTSKSPRHIR